MDHSISSSRLADARSAIHAIEERLQELAMEPVFLLLDLVLPAPSQTKLLRLWWGDHQGQFKLGVTYLAPATLQDVSPRAIFRPLDEVSWPLLLAALDLLPRLLEHLKSQARGVSERWDAVPSILTQALSLAGGAA